MLLKILNKQAFKFLEYKRDYDDDDDDDEDDDDYKPKKGKSGDLIENLEDKLYERGNKVVESRRK